MRIAFFDLNHNSRGIYTNTVPLGSGLIATYLRKNIDYDFDIKIFKDPAKAMKILEKWVPDIAGLAQYSWNSNLNLYFSKRIKDINPNSMVVAGGPNLCRSRQLRQDYLRRNSSVDICVAFDGEEPFTEIVRRILSGQTNEQIRKNPVDGSYSLDPKNGLLVESLKILPRLNSLDAFGPVYAEGIFDQLLDQGLYPFVQTHRGCPFTCAFCHTSDRYYSSMIFLSPEIFEQDMEYLGKRFQDNPNITLYLANTNMSLFKEDFAIAEVIRKIQDKYNWPRSVRFSSGKDPDKLFKMLSVIDFMPALALQTLTPHVLENIKRKNIPFDKFVDFQNKVSGRTGKLTFTELILCLPGETKESFLETLRRVINSGIENIVIYTLMYLKGTSLCSPENAAKYNYDIRHRIVPRQFSLINDTKILDTEEVIVATNTMSYQDYLELREIALTVTVFSSSAELVPLKRFIAEQNIDVAQWVFNIHDRMKDISSLNEVHKEFLRETEQELFPTRQALLDFFNLPENYQVLCSGKLGDNLLRKYKCILLTNHYKQVLKLAISQARRLGGQSLDNKLRDLGEYLSVRDIKRYFIEASVNKVQYFHLNYDIPNWLTNNKEKLPLENFQGPFNYRVEKSERAEKQFADIVDIKNDFELSLQILYRDWLTSQLWPVWSKVRQ